MQQEQKHQMNLIETHPSGIEEWHCPHCNRRMVMQWMPYKKLILEDGDNYALHSAFKGDIQLQTSHAPSQLEPEEAEDMPIISEELRAALDDFLKDLDFGD